jgi:hypothetical protein
MAPSERGLYRLYSRRILAMTQQRPPIASYRYGAELAPHDGAPVRHAVNKAFAGVTWTILAMVLVVWAVVGAIFWIPLMLRSVIQFSLRHLQAVFVGKRPEGAARALQGAVSFYRRGFVVAFEVIMRDEVDGNAKDPETGNLLLLELLWAIPVWYLILFGVGWIQASPMDLWNGLGSIQWGQPLGSLFDWVRG